MTTNANKIEVVRGLCAEEYHAMPFCSASRLKVLTIGTPRHLTERMANPEVTRQMRLGTYTHSATLEPDSWDSTYCVVPCGDRKAKMFKDAVAANTDRECMTESEAASAKAMAAAIRAHPSASAIIEVCEEREIVLLGTLNGVKVKARPDLLSFAHGIMGDVKSMSGHASDDECSMYAWRFGVFLQGCFYRRLVRACAEFKTWAGFRTIFVESESPHCVVTRTMADMDLDLMDNRLDAAIAKWKRWEANPNEGWLEDGTALRIPAWAERNMMHEQETFIGN